MKLSFSEEYILENEFVRLSPLNRTHFQGLAKIADDADIWTFFLEKGQSAKEFESYINHAINQRDLHNEYPFVVFDKVKDAYAGMTRFYAYSSELQSIKLGHTWLGKEFRGTGLNKNSKYLLFEFAFEKLMVERIGFGAYATNTTSIAAMKSVGCKQEGTLRNLFPSIYGSGRTDCVLYSILREEWENEAKSLLSQKLS